MQYALLTLLVLAPALHAENWPDYRGPTGQGTYPGKVPVEWSPTKNVAWKTKIPGHGWSSPIVWQERVYLTTAVPQEKDHSLRAICVDAKTGKILWNNEVFLQKGASAPRIHRKNSHASPSIVTDGERLYAHFGHQGTAALKLDGTVVWRNDSLKYRPVHGNGGSPILVDDLLVFSIDGADKQLVVALDKATGKVRWRTPRNNKAGRSFSFTTPRAIDVNGQTQIVSPASDMVAGYDPKNGKEIWRVVYSGYSVIPRPVYGQGLVFIATGYDSPKLLAIRPDGKGDITRDNVAWTLRRGAPHTPSLLLVGEELYFVSDRGSMNCLDAKTGKVHWQDRLAGNFSASPLYADGKVYFPSEAGVVYVVKAGKKFELLAKNDMEERLFASLAPVDGKLYLRTETQLYCIEEKE